MIERSRGSERLLYYKLSYDATDDGNYRGLKFLDGMIKVLEHVLESHICSQVDITTCGLVLCLGAVSSIAVAIYISRQMQEKHRIKKKKIYSAFIELEKSFNYVPRTALWWAKRKVRIDEWIVRLLKVMYDRENSRLRVSSSFGERLK